MASSQPIKQAPRGQVEPGVFDTVDEAIQAAKQRKRALKIAPWQPVKGNSRHPCCHASTSARVGSENR